MAGVAGQGKSRGSRISKTAEGPVRNPGLSAFGCCYRGRAASKKRKPGYPGSAVCGEQSIELLSGKRFRGIDGNARGESFPVAGNFGTDRPFTLAITLCY
ncbi:Hypothetical protein NTJ_07731 [Nesidiocoris tenuis]|uniref:Uncharacterized protein n=1 Tax=Nesidiocoris tenuis TaxID=355587 RepID=A0ABN7AU81_9HEMI|nr:Hypothetical protein NTJ_07731 [Nesidiocoris tenuis]